MSKGELIPKIAEAIAHQEGFYITEEQARRRGIRWPSLSQRHANPGNVRRWSPKHPVKNGYVDFVAWAGGDYDRAVSEGWRVLKALIEQYIAGKYHNGKSPTLYEMFEKFAPASDKNHPKAYAEFVAERVGIAPDIPLAEVLS